MSDWDGRPQNPERTAPHWFRTPEGHDVIVWWHCEATSMWWDRPVQAMGFTYLGPCHTPVEVAALIEAARREERERQLKLLHEAHAAMRACGWHQAMEGDPISDGVLEAACTEIEAAFAAMLGTTKEDTGHE
jgi:hypothetical protein